MEEKVKVKEAPAAPALAAMDVMLTDDALLAVCGWLDSPADVARLAATCARLRDVVAFGGGHALWRRLFARRFGRDAAAAVEALAKLHGVGSLRRLLLLPHDEAVDADEEDEGSVASTAAAAAAADVEGGMEGERWQAGVAGGDGASLAAAVRQGALSAARRQQGGDRRR